MTKRAGRQLFSWITIVAMILSLFPSGLVEIAHAQNGGTDRSDDLIGPQSAVKQGGVFIEEGGELSSTEPIVVELSFGVPVEGDEPTPDNPVQWGDYAIFNLSSAFSLESSDDIDLEAPDGTLVGHVSIEKDPVTKMVYARVLFDGDVTVFDGTYNSVQCSFQAEFEYDGSGEAGTPGDHEVMILEKTYIVNVPPAEIIYEVTKSGTENLAEKYIEWAVELSATQDGTPVNLAGYQFVDDLGSVGAYIAGSFTVGGSFATPVEDGGELSYQFPAGSLSPQKVTFRTEIPDSAYLATTEQSITNTGQLLDSEDLLVKEGEFTVKFTPQWIEKTGSTNDTGGGSGDYDPSGRTITWTIIANQMEAALKDVVITDLLPAGLVFHSAYWEKWDGTADEWIDKTWFTGEPAGGKYELGDIDTRVRLTIVTNVPDQDYTAGVTTYRNNAEISWEGLPGTAPGSSKGIGVGYTPIAKSGKVEDTAKGIIAWEVSVDPRGQTIPDLAVYDLLVYGSSTSGFSLSSATGFPAGLDPQLLTPRYDQKYIADSFTGTGLALTVHPISQGGERVADLLEITGFPDSKTFSFESLITDPGIFAGNKSSTMRNTAALFSGSTRLNLASGSVTFVSKTLSKEMLKRGHLDNPAAGVNDYTTAAAEGFDYEDKSVIFRLGVNADGLDLGNMENAAGQALGKATVTDTLPEGWEFVDFADDSPYLIFKAEKVGNTLRATGNPLDPTTWTGFQAAFNAAGRTATFTFDTLDQPYVILLKAKPNDDTLAGYFDGNKTITKRNELSLKAENWDPGVSTHRDVTIVSRYLDKDCPPPKDGVIQWIVEYQPYDLPGGGTKIFDMLPEGVELRTDSAGTLLIDGNITACELILQNDGSYTEGDPVALLAGENVTYDNPNRLLTLFIPDESKAYRFTYLTDITGEPGEIINRVVLCGESEEREETSKNYVITQKDGWATMQRNGWIEIKKVDGNSGVPLPGAEYTLYGIDGETVIRKGMTGSEGTLKFKVIPDGEYIFRETAPPAGYTAEIREHTLTVETVGGTVYALIDGKGGAEAHLITIKNYREGTAGNLTLGKIAAGNGAGKIEQFDFTVYFEGAGGVYGYFGSGGAPDGTISSGETVSLAHGESITITGLPKGAGYTVFEADYAYEGYITDSEGAGGTITADATEIAEFTNTRNVGALTIAKLVDGNAADESKKFDFTVEFAPPAGMAVTYPYSVDGVPAGMLTGGETISLAHGESVTITDLPEGTAYSISEADYTEEGYITAAEGEEGVIATGETETALFTNTRNEGALVISKRVEGELGDRDRAFTFVVDLDAGGSYRYRGSKSGTIESGGTITLKHGQHVIIEGILVGTSYSVTELEADKEGYRTSSTGAVGEIALEGRAAEFVNTKEHLPQTEGTAPHSKLLFTALALLFAGLLLQEVTWGRTYCHLSRSSRCRIY